MNERDFKVLLEAGAIKTLSIIGNGCHFHLEVKTQGAGKPMLTARGGLRQWRTLDASAKWLRKHGVGLATIQIEHWQPDQRSLLKP